jgi:hypothetical protein
MSKLLTLLCLFPSLVAGGGHTGSSSSSSSSAEAGSAADTDGYQQGAACYGFGGGHGVWKCGTSAAWCTEIGGVARYVEDYRSRRSGACMCETGCTDPASIVPGFSKADGHDGKACYGSSTAGDHSVKCGVSADDCSTIGGYAYAPGYVSSQSGCCMCNENCDHDLETGSDCTYYDTVSSPLPPPLPPSPPPSPSFPPVLGDEATNVFIVSITLNMTGTLSAIEDSDGTYTKTANALKNALTIPMAVHVDDISVEFSEGSIIAAISIKVPDQASVDKVQAVIDGNMATAADAESFLGSSAMPCVEKYTSGRYAGYCKSRATVQAVMSAVVDNTSSPVVMIVIIVVGVLALVVVGLVVMKMMKPKAGPVKGSA